MVKTLGITIDDWLYQEIENRRGSMNRSEFISQQVAIAMGFSKGVSNE